MELFGTCTRRYAPYIHQSHDSIVELWRTFPNGSLSVGENIEKKSKLENSISVNIEYVSIGEVSLLEIKEDKITGNKSKYYIYSHNKIKVQRPRG